MVNFVCIDSVLKFLQESPDGTKIPIVCHEQGSLFLTAEHIDGEGYLFFADGVVSDVVSYEIEIVYIVDYTAKVCNLAYIKADHIH